MSKALKVGDYSVIKQLGAGNFGKAYICYNAALNSEKYVLKQINLDALNEHDKKSAIQEAELLKKLSCHCIVRYIDSFMQNQTLSIVMEYCDGGDLSSVIATRKQMKQLFLEGEIKNVLCQIAIALVHCHAMNVVHRDIKTENVFICKNGRVKLGDFGVSKQMKDSNSMVQTTIGTPYYLSPEICKGEPYNAKSDIWGLGIIIYEMINFHRPFEAAGIATLVMSITRSKFKPLSPKYADRLRLMVETMLNKDPNLRPSAKDILLHKVMIQTTHALKPLTGNDLSELDVNSNKNQSNIAPQTKYADIERMMNEELDQLEANHMDEIDALFASLK